MIKPIEVCALPNYRIYVKFSDGVEGEVDLSDLVGKGVLETWRDPHFFQQVHIGAGRRIQWSGEIALCPDALYMRVTGKTPEEVFPQLVQESTHV